MMPQLVGYKPKNFEKLVDKEANIQALLYSKAIAAGLEMYLEFALPSENHRKHCVADCVLICKKRVIAIVEIKRGKKPTWLQRIKKKNGRQIKAYADLRDAYGVRVFYACQNTDMDDLVLRLKRVRKRFLAEW